MSKVAVVLFNLGGPDRPEAVRPFLFNLFNDPAIIGAPGAARWLLAQFISRRRAPVARDIYAKLGGGSPLLPNTERQARALEGALGGSARVFIAMRYWHPFADQTAAEVKAFEPDHVILLPLYPQFSSTTSGSSLKDWTRAAAAVGLSAPTSTVCCYPREGGFVDEVVERLRAALDEARGAGQPRVLFSAHGLPKKVVDGGDPYQWQVEESVKAVVEALGDDGGEADLDWQTCYQSRVGPLEWIGPSTDDEIKRAGKDGVPVVVVPIAFVSEHSETLVELDIEYAHLAERSGVPTYVRVPTVSDGAHFIGGLARLVRAAEERAERLSSGEGMRICPEACSRCPYEAA
jgi:ferrochelatase